MVFIISIIQKNTAILIIEGTYGLGIFGRVSIKNWLGTWCHTDDTIALFILNKSVFGFENNLYLGCVCVVSENSTYLKHNEYDLQLDEVAKIPSECGILLCGDFNARTNVSSDHDCVCVSDAELGNLMPSHIGESCHMISVLNEIGRLVRFSRDKAVRLSHDHGLGEFTRKCYCRVECCWLCNRLPCYI